MTIHHTAELAAIERDHNRRLWLDSLRRNRWHQRATLESLGGARAAVYVISGLMLVAFGDSMAEQIAVWLLR